MPNSFGSLSEEPFDQNLKEQPLSGGFKASQTCSPMEPRPWSNYECTRHIVNTSNCYPSPGTLLMLLPTLSPLNVLIPYQ